MKTMCKVSFATALAAGLLLAQGDKPVAPAAEPEYFRLDFVVKEVEHGKTVNSRNYSLLTLANGKEQGSIRAGSKMPIATGTQQFQYFDVGVNIDCNSMQRQRDRLTMGVRADLSIAAPPEDKVLTRASVRNVRWGSAVTIPIGKPATLFSSDDLASTRTLQLEVTATPVR